MGSSDSDEGVGEGAFVGSSTTWGALVGVSSGETEGEISGESATAISPETTLSAGVGLGSR